MAGALARIDERAQSDDRSTLLTSCRSAGRRNCSIWRARRVYYLPKPTSTTDLTLMRRIDELHLEHPFSGARVLRDLLRLEGHQLGRKHVGTLMARMGIEALYRTSPTPAEASPVHSIYPYLLGDRLVERPRQGDYPRGSFDEMAYPAAHGLELFDLLV